MNILFLLLPCTWLLTGGWLFLSSSHWDFSAFDRPDFLIFTALWNVLGLIAIGILTLTYLHLPADLQTLLSTGATYLDRMPAKNESHETDNEPGLLSLQNIIAYTVIDPFGKRTERNQARDEAQWRQTQTLRDT